MHQYIYMLLDSASCTPRFVAYQARFAASGSIEKGEGKLQGLVLNSGIRLLILFFLFSLSLHRCL